MSRCDNFCSGRNLREEKGEAVCCCTGLGFVLNIRDQFSKGAGFGCSHSDIVGQKFSLGPFPVLINQWP